jgi:hydroxymethylpyrimidine/phosphomethylpyrimidine kinase
VITCITAQNPREVKGVQACSAAMVQSQMEAVFAELPPIAAKTGMLYSRAIIEEVAGFLSERRFRKLVVDPVMVATSGAVLLRPAAIEVLVKELLPLACLVTPNLQEAEMLVGRDLGSVEDLRGAARVLYRRFGCAALLKGGHLRGLKEAVDVFYDGKEELLLRAPFVRGVSTHGTGCTYSAAITAYLAVGCPLGRAVCQAKEFITQAIAQNRKVGAHTVLNSFWKQQT